MSFPFLSLYQTEVPDAEMSLLPNNILAKHERAQLNPDEVNSVFHVGISAIFKAGGINLRLWRFRNPCHLEFGAVLLLEVRAPMLTAFSHTAATY
ncbi:MAG: hypothetical protein ACJ71U_17645 [Terriglobales bacterium]